MGEGGVGVGLLSPKHHRLPQVNKLYMEQPQFQPEDLQDLNYKPSVLHFHLSWAGTQWLVILLQESTIFEWLRLGLSLFGLNFYSDIQVVDDDGDIVIC